MPLVVTNRARSNRPVKQVRKVLAKFEKVRTLTVLAEIMISEVPECGGGNFKQE
jgi:hypothetical protein